ncbi:MAG: hypothetical protein OXL97_08805 [Chloroflexota bacterium]|nr:hypothetical protein [Chloroflexota bacterium]
MVVVSGYPISHAEFMERRQHIADGVMIAERGFGTSHEKALLEAAERYGVDSIALAFLIADYSLLAAAIEAGHEASDEEIQQQLALLGVAPEDRDMGEQTDLAEFAVLTQEFVFAELERIAREELDRIPDAAEVTNLELTLRIRWTTASTADVELTGDPAIDATPQEALAYLESLWAWAVG